MKRVSVLLLLMSTAVGGAQVATRMSGITVQFVARGMQPTLKELREGDPHGISPGHIFMIVTVPTAHGPKEEAYGFYPAADNLHAIIKGPGMLKSEYRCNPNDDCNPDQYGKFLKRLSESEDSVSIFITEGQRRVIFEDIYKWNREYGLLASDTCIDFVGTVANHLGFPTPPRKRLQSPVEYLNQLKPLVAEEQRRREAELAADAQAWQERGARAEAAVRAEAQAKAETAARAQAAARSQAQARADAAARAQAQARADAASRAAQTPPPGWIVCTCPSQHLFSGRWFGRLFFHPAGGPLCK